MQESNAKSMKQRNTVSDSSAEVSITTTLLRTIGLVGLTLVLACLMRFVPFMAHAVQYVAGTSAWEWLYGVFGIDSSLGREQMLLIGIMATCFVMALCLQTAFVYIVSRLRRSSRSGR